MELYFLGTVAGTPSRERNVSSIALRLFEERGCFWLFDCGEGTQHQILKSPLRLSKLEKIFITHLHGDHIYGLPGLLTSRSYHESDVPLTIYGPPGIKRYIETVLDVSQAHLDYSLDVVEINEGHVFKDEQFQVESRLLEHRIDSYGYRITEQDRPGHLQHEKLMSLGLPPGPNYARIKKGENIQLEDGRLLQAADFLSEPRRGRVVTILGDTRICNAAKDLAKGADLLVHEATFEHGLEEKAHKYFHSTAVQAAKLASQCKVRELVLTHFSSRYQGERIHLLVDEAKMHHPKVHAASDFSMFPVVIDPAESL